jgi:hypothetical protein
MGTRATYQIGKHVFYIHWDGYEDGAAVYFYNMIEANNKLDDSGIDRPLNSGGYAENFLRGNPGAEFTESHEIHGDTEYQYTLDADTLTLTVVELGWDRGVDGYKKVKNQYNIGLDEFINKHQKCLEDHKVVRYAYNAYGGTTLMTKENLEDLLRAEEKLQITWAANGNNKGANWNSLCEKIDRIKDALTKV